VFYGGSLSSIAGTASKHMARWTSAGFGTLVGGTVDSFVNSLAYTRGTLVAGGAFVSAGGTSAWRVAQWVANAWGTLLNQGASGAGSINDAVAVVTEGLDRKIYIGGAFGSAGGTAASLITSWNGTFGTLGGGLRAALNDSADAIVFGPNAILYAGGVLANGTAGGSIPVNYTAQWNGVQWSALGSGVTNSLQGMYADVTTGEIYAGGALITVETLAFSPAMLYAVWNGFRWLPGEVLFPSGAVNGASAFLMMADRQLYLAGDFRGIGTAAAVTTIVNTATRDTYPRPSGFGIPAQGRRGYSNSTTTRPAIGSTSMPFSRAAKRQR
jgi:hypothetical protein